MESARLLQVAASAVLAFSAGCGLATDCTLLPCLGGLRVQFSTPASTPYRVEISSAASGATYAFDCANIQQCDRNGTYFADYYGENVTVKVITSSGTTRSTVYPVYVESRPNGAGCGTSCRIANVTVDLPPV